TTGFGREPTKRRGEPLRVLDEVSADQSDCLTFRDGSARLCDAVTTGLTDSPTCITVLAMSARSSPIDERRTYSRASRILSGRIRPTYSASGSVAVASSAASSRYL